MNAIQIINKLQKEISQDFTRSSSNQLSRKNPKVPLKETHESSNFSHINALKLLFAAIPWNPKMDHMSLRGKLFVYLQVYMVLDFLHTSY